MRNIVLTGFMGSGKTVVGKIVSVKLGLKFTDIDRCIEDEQDRTITAMFSQQGEAYFRKLESDMVQRVSQEENQVIATGGGVVLDPVNMKNLREKGIIFWLSVLPEEVQRRTQGNTGRPLLDGAYPQKTIEELFRYREPLYGQADYKIETSDLAVEEVANKVLEIFGDR